MDTRQRIIFSIYSELSNITKTHGYGNDITHVKKGFYDSASLTNFPVAMVYTGEDTAKNQLEGQYFGESTLKVAVFVVINSPVDTRIDNTESIIQDLYRFFNKDENIAPAYVSGLSNVEYVQNYSISSVAPYIATATNLSALEFVIEVDYINFIDADVTPPTPDVPVLTTPTNGYTTGNINQAFNWGDATNAVSYHFELATDNAFASLIIDQTYLSNTSFTVPSDVHLLTGTTYYWRVKSLGTVFNSDWSTVWSFVVNEVLIPDVPVLDSPADLATMTDVNAITFKWNTSARAITYDFQIASDTGFSTIVSNQTGLTETTASYTPTTVGTTKYWRVRATNSYGSSAYSAYRTYTNYTLQAETTALIARMTIKPTMGRQYLMDLLTSGLKTDGIWTKLDCFYMLAHETNTNGEALLNWIQNKNNATLQGACTFTIDRGIQGDTSTKYIKTNFSPSVDGTNYTQISASFGCYSRTESDGNYGDMGNSAVSGWYNYIIGKSSSIFTGRINWATGNAITVTTDTSLGLMAINRTATNSYGIYKNGIRMGVVADDSTPLQNYPIYIGSGGSYTALSGRQYAMAFIGGALTNINMRDLNYRIETFLTAIGARV